VRDTHIYFSEGLIATVLPLLHFSTTGTKFALMGEGAVLGLKPAATVFQAALQYEKQIYQTRRWRKKKCFKYKF